MTSNSSKPNYMTTNNNEDNSASEPSSDFEDKNLKLINPTETLNPESLSLTALNRNNSDTNDDTPNILTASSQKDVFEINVNEINFSEAENAKALSETSSFNQSIQQTNNLTKNKNTAFDDKIFGINTNIFEDGEK